MHTVTVLTMYESDHACHTGLVVAAYVSFIFASSSSLVACVLVLITPFSSRYERRRLSSHLHFRSEAH